ncbi:BON domain-containing protein [Mariniblastus sp.]|nr:BON domain-containing protein [Mariniblastus sp.]
MPEPQASQDQSSPSDSQPSSSDSQPSPSDSFQQKLRERFELLGYPQLQAVECSLEDGTVQLTGQVDSFYLKQVAQSVAAKIAGPHCVQNMIKVN